MTQTVKSRRAMMRTFDLNNEMQVTALAAMAAGSLPKTIAGFEMGPGRYLSPTTVYALKAKGLCNVVIQGRRSHAEITDHGRVVVVALEGGAS